MEQVLYNIDQAYLFMTIQTYKVIKSNSFNIIYASRLTIKTCELHL